MSVVTPPRKPANGAGPRRIQMTRAEKQAILDNFDLEVAHRLSNLRMLNETLLRSFLARQETEISRIPLELRRMPVRELGEKWSGGLKGVVEGLARGRVVEEQQEQEQQEEEEGEPRGKAAAKRKRPTTASQLSTSTQDRGGKTARTNSQEATTIAHGGSSRPRKKPTTSTTSTTTTINPDKPLPQEPTTITPSSSSTTGVPPTSAFSFLPPQTPSSVLSLKGVPRRPRRNESIALSTNGSPLIIDAGAVRRRGGGHGEGEEDEDGEEGEGTGGEDDEEGEEVVLDEEALMRRLEAAGKEKASTEEGGSSTDKTPARKAKTGSIKHARTSSIQLSASNPDLRGAVGSSSVVLQSPSQLQLDMSIPLANGLTLTFNALSDSPSKIDAVLLGGGDGGSGVPLVDEEERARIKSELARRVRAVGERLGKWKLS